MPHYEYRVKEDLLLAFFKFFSFSLTDLLKALGKKNQHVPLCLQSWHTDDCNRVCTIVHNADLSGYKQGVFQIFQKIGQKGVWAHSKNNSVPGVSLWSFCQLDVGTTVIDSWELMSQKNFDKYYLIFPHNKSEIFRGVYILSTLGRGGKEKKISYLFIFSISVEFRS